MCLFEGNQGGGKVNELLLLLFSLIFINFNLCDSELKKEKKKKKRHKNARDEEL